jgi:alcohol dehydrogenase-like protein
VRVAQLSISSSDLWPYQSMPGGGVGKRAGHEFGGAVEETGSDVADFKRGDPVVVPFPTLAIAPAVSLARLKSTSSTATSIPARAGDMAIDLTKARPGADDRRCLPHSTIHGSTCAGVHAGGQTR